MNMVFPNETQLAELREKYPAGCRVRLIHMDDPYTKLQPSAEGTVVFVDDIGTVHVNWDEGSSLGLIPGEDDFEILVKR